MAPKRKDNPSASSSSLRENPKTSDALDLDHIPLVDQFFKIIDIACKFDMLELQNWLKQTYIDSKDEINPWESLFPLYMFPQTRNFLDLVMSCQAKYNRL